MGKSDGWSLLRGHSNIAIDTDFFGIDHGIFYNMLYQGCSDWPELLVEILQERATLAPKALKGLAVAAPKPEPAPVIIAVAPLIFIINPYIRC